MSNVPDLPAMIDAIHEARVVDFMRFVGRRLVSDPRLADMSFRDGWNLMVGEYAQKAASRV